MTVNRPIWMQAAGADTALQYSAQELRAVLEGVFKSEGILPAFPNSCLVSQRGAGANFSVDIAPGHMLIQGDDVSNQGLYLVKVQATENLATPSAPGTGTRVHRVVMQVRDKLHNGSWTTYDAVPVLVQDTGSGTPAVPNSALHLGLVSIAAGQASVQNANITDGRINARVASLLMDPIQVSNGINVSTTAGSYVALGTPLAMTFVGPASGAVWVNLTASLESVSTSWAQFGFEIRQTNISGTVIHAASDVECIQVQGTSFAMAGNRVLVTGLTPGQLYFIRDMGKSSAAGDTASFFFRKINVEAVQ